MTSVFLTRTGSRPWGLQQVTLPELELSWAYMAPGTSCAEPVSWIAPGQLNVDTEMLCQQWCSKALLIVSRDCFALLPTRSHESQCTKLFPGNAAYSKSGSVPGLVLASWQCQDYRRQYLCFSRRAKGKQKSLIQERASKVKADAKYDGKRTDYGETLERSMVQAWICRRAAAARCCELRSQGVGREPKRACGVVWGILIQAPSAWSDRKVVSQNVWNKF